MRLEPWQKNLYAIFIAQFFVIMGFNFVNPFLPLFIQELGNYSNEEAAFWSGMATAAFGITLFLSGPLWGIVADRWGRKAMLLRAQFCSSFILLGMGFSPNVFWVVALRAVQGLFSGTMTAAQAMVAGGTPREKFERPPDGESVSLVSMLRLAMSRQMLPLLMTLCVLQVGPQMIHPVIPVFIRDIDPAAKAATLSGITFGLMGVTAAISSIATARIGGRISLKTILVFSCLTTGLLYLPPVWAGTVSQVILSIALTGFLKGGLMASSSALVGLSAGQAQQGIAYGVAQSANALGIGIGPLLGGILAPLVGLRAVFGIAGGLFMAIGLFVFRLLSDVSLDSPKSLED